MAREFLPLMMKDLEIDISGSKISRVALNRHMPKVDQVKSHHHPFDQWLLYLRGSGFQLIGEESTPVRRGSFIILPEGQNHGFLKEKNLSPMCLAIDITMGEKTENPVVTRISGEALLAIEQTLHQLAVATKHPFRFAVAAGVLNLVKTLELEQTRNEMMSGRYLNLVRKQIDRSDFKDATPEDIARATGKSLNYLNRQLKNEAGTTVARLLTSGKFERCCRDLERTTLSVSEIAEQVGIYDQNYFARWFRKQSGLSPTQWRNTKGH